MTAVKIEHDFENGRFDITTAAQNLLRGGRGVARDGGTRGNIT